MISSTTKTATRAIIAVTCMLLAFLLACSNAQTLSSHFGHLMNSQALIKQINLDEKSTFKAQSYPRFESTAKLINFARQYSDSKLNQALKKVTQKFVSKDLPIPQSYDLRKIWNQCVGDIQNEGQCGAVWAMVPSATVSDRMCIQSSGKFEERLSTQYVLECDDRDFGCNGGNLNTEFEFELKKGIPTEKCVPYNAGNGTLSKCPTKCVNGEPLILYKTKAVQNLTGEHDMQQAILQGGSIMTELDIYQDFLYYSSGVYQHGVNMRQPIAKYVVRIIGWGIDKGVNYWIIPNIWGNTWGMQGYIWIRRGINESNIEKDAFAFQVY